GQQSRNSLDKFALRPVQAAGVSSLLFDSIWLATAPPGAIRQPARAPPGPRIIATSSPIASRRVGIVVARSQVTSSPSATAVLTVSFSLNFGSFFDASRNAVSNSRRSEERRGERVEGRGVAVSVDERADA